MPVVNGNGTITVDVALNNPDFIRDTIEAIPADYSFASAFFQEGDEAMGGSAMYEQYLAVDYRFGDRDVQAIEPGAEFPEVSLVRPDVLVSKVAKWGGQATLPYETINRNRTGEMRDRLVVLSNTIARKTANVCLGALNAAPIQTHAIGTAWTGAGDPIADLNTIYAKIRTMEIDDSYASAPLVILANYNDIVKLANNASARALLPREGGNSILNVTTFSPIEALGATWVPSQRCPAGTMYVGIQGKAGRIHPETQLEQTSSGLYSRIVDEPLNERKVVMAARIFVPAIGHPKSVVRVTGIA